MEIVFDQNSFQGYHKDEESKDLFTEAITVNGFIEEDRISFIVKYPYEYYEDEETRELKVNYEKDHPGGEYIGRYDPINKKYKGHWSLLLEEEEKGLFQDDYFEVYIKGYWEMWRV